MVRIVSPLTLVYIMQTTYLPIALPSLMVRLVLCTILVVRAGAFAAEPFDQRVQKLIEQLGDDDFFARERAQRELADLAFEAFEALDAARNHEDLEIAARARRVLQSMKVQWTTRDDPPAVQNLLAAYKDLSTSEKRARMRALAELPDGQGVAGLCRVVRYEKSSVLSKAAALDLLGMVPDDAALPKNLAETLREQLNVSHRPAAYWLMARIQFDADPAAAADRWGKLVEAENTRLKNTPERTSDRIVAALVRIQVEVLKRLQRNDEATAAMRRLLALERGNPETLAKLLDWLVDQKAWPEIDEIAERFQSHFAGRPALLYTVAQAQAERGDPELAEKTAARALAFNPGSDSGPLTIHYTTARELNSRGLTEWAEQECRHVLLTGAAKEPVVRLALGQLLAWLVERESWKKIDTLGSELETRLGDNPLLLYTLAQSQAEQGNAQQAEQTAQRALELHPGSQPELLLKHLAIARVLRDRKLFAWAERELLRVIDVEKEDSGALAELADCLAQRKAWPEVQKLAKRFAERFSENVLLLYMLAQAQAEQGSAEQAEQTAQKALGLSPGNHVEALYEHLKVGRLLRARGMFPWAKLEFRHVVKSGQPGDSGVVSALYQLGEMLHDQGEDLEAGLALQELVDGVAKRPGRVQLDPAELATFRARASYFQACHWQSRKDTAKQRQFLEKALQADQADLDVLIACHQLPDETPEFRARIQKLIVDATAGLRAEIADAPNDPAGYNQFAWLVGNTDGDLEEALRCSLKSVELSPNSGGYYDTLAHVHYAMGQYDKAVTAQTKAARLEPHSSVIRRKLEEFRKKAEENRNQ
ncbi:MAG: hypothetical protein HQ567_25535 [Candidatus Nealsonbacteria bacterium]|nr:hypothetical protein [Candidatus Nealsonbacteria bacterium]